MYEPKGTALDLESSQVDGTDECDLSLVRLYIAQELNVYINAYLKHNIKALPVW